MEIFELQDGRFARAAAGTEGSLDDVPGCAGLTLHLDELWRELARLAPNDDAPNDDAPSDDAPNDDAPNDDAPSDDARDA